MSTSTKKTRAFSKTTRQREAIALLGGSASQVLLYGGSRSGKTVIALYALLCRAIDRKSRHLILRLHFNHIKTSIWLDTLPKVLALVAPDLQVNWNKTDYVLEFPHNGSEVWIGGLDDKERTEKILGTEYSTIFFNECSQLTYDAVETARTRLAENSGLTLKAYYDENPPRAKHWTHKLWIDHVSPDDGGPLADPSDYASLLMNPEDNRVNLPPGYIETVLARLSKRKRDRFLLGLWGTDTEGALWKADWIRRGEAPPDLERIVVAVDPAVTKSKKSDETGIMVAGKLGNRLYVLEDVSGRYTPHEWGWAAVDAYRRWGADRIIGEVNNGGDLVATNIRQHDRLVSYKDVHASRGKAVRAEPVSALYEQGLGIHCGEFPELEDQLTGWVPGDDDSPDRLDALVWAATELLLEVPTETQYVTYDDRQDITPY